MRFLSSRFFINIFPILMRIMTMMVASLLIINKLILKVEEPSAQEAEPADLQLAYVSLSGDHIRACRI